MTKKETSQEKSSKGTKHQKMELTYEEAMQQLEELVQKMERGEMVINELSAGLKEAQRLIVFCKQQLQKVDDEIQQSLNECCTESI